MLNTTTLASSGATTLSSGIGYSVTPATTTYYSTSCCVKKQAGVYEFIIYTFDEEDFELLDEGKIYANDEKQARELALFDFAKSDDKYDFEDLIIEVRKFN